MAEYIDKETTAHRLLKHGVKRKIVEEAVLNVPANNVRWYKSGKWERHPLFKEWSVCTACGLGCKLRDCDDDGITEYIYKFCPHCGAEMETIFDE